jgi:hypothetical protein
MKVSTQKVSNTIVVGKKVNGITVHYDSAIGTGFGATLHY